MPYCYLLDACSFLIKDTKGVYLKRKRSGEELGVVKGRKTLIRIYCMREENLKLNKKNT